MKCQKNKELSLNDAYKYLDRDRFHLSLEVRWNGLIPYRIFYLFRNYPNGDHIFYSVDNKVILSGDDRNKADIEKLVEYLKNHQKIDTVKVESKFITTYSLTMAIIASINMICCLFHLIPMPIIRFMNVFILSSELPMLLLVLFRWKSLDKNHQVDLIETSENFRMERPSKVVVKNIDTENGIITYGLERKIVEEKDGSLSIYEVEKK